MLHYNSQKNESLTNIIYFVLKYLINSKWIFSLQTLYMYRQLILLICCSCRIYVSYYFHEANERYR